MKLNKTVTPIFISLFTLLALLLAACGDGPTPAPAPAQPLAAATATSVPPTPTLAPPPTATLTALQATEWATIKSIGAEVRTEPRSNADFVEKLSGYSVVALQRKLLDESWWERIGGGWIAHNDMIVYRTEMEARRSIPKATLPPTPVPTYNPNQPTFGPLASTLNAGIYSTADQTKTAIAAATARAQAPKAPVANGGGANGAGSGGSDAVRADPVACLPAAFAGTEVQACVSNSNPAKGDVVTVYGRLIIDGKAIAGVDMVTGWGFSSGVLVCSGTSGANGVASCSRDTSSGVCGCRVNIEVAFLYKNQVYDGQTSFKIR